MLDELDDDEVRTYLLSLGDNGKINTGYRKGTKNFYLERAATIFIRRRQGHTLKSVGITYGLTPERVRQINSKTTRILNYKVKHGL